MKKFSREELKSLILEIDNLWRAGDIGSIATGGQSSRSSTSSKVDSDGTVTITPKDPSGKLNCLFIGDSQIHRDSGHGQTSFPCLLRDEHSDKYNVEMRTKNGKTLQEMDQSLSSIAGTNYDVITIMGGGNNASNEIGSAEHSRDKSLYDKMYQKAKTSGIDTIVVAVTNPTKIHYEHKDRFPSNEALAEHVRSTSGYDILIDANQIFRSESDFKGKYLTPAAHKKLRDLFNSKIKRAAPPQNELKIRSLIRNKLLQF